MNPPEQENLPCPRCDSTKTKFCYYNNYNLSQPRHFCKACRRYWTRGGTLRNVPVGGGSRKNSKRTRSSTSAVNAPHGYNTASFVEENVHETAPYENLVMGVKTEMPSCDVALNQGSFTSLLTCNAGGGPYVGFSNGYGGVGLGLGLGSGFGPSMGFDEMGFELGFGPTIVEGNQSGGGNTWQSNGGDRMDGGDCFG